MDENVNTSQTEDDAKELIDQGETQVFQSDFRDYKMPCSPKDKKRHFRFIVYVESAPEGWMNQLENTGLPFAVSPLHDQDAYPDGSLKKPHWHVIVSYSNTTTYQNAVGLREITHGPYPLLCDNVAGAYAYFTHKHDPNKAQYNPDEIRCFNGFQVTLTTEEARKIRNELTEMCIEQVITEYSELVALAMFLGNDYQNIAQNQTMYFNGFCGSLRHNPLPTMQRFAKGLLERDAPGDRERYDALMCRIEQVRVARTKAKDIGG